MVERESDKKLVKNHSEVPDLKQEGLRILRNMEEERALSRGQRFLYGPVGFETFEENLSEGFQNTVGNWQSQEKPGTEASMWNHQPRQRAGNMVPSGG